MIMRGFLLMEMGRQAFRLGRAAPSPLLENEMKVIKADTTYQKPVAYLSQNGTWSHTNNDPEGAAVYLIPNEALVEEILALREQLAEARKDNARLRGNVQAKAVEIDLLMKVKK